jgi:hypothetical protein
MVGEGNKSNIRKKPTYVESCRMDYLCKSLTICISKLYSILSINILHQKLQYEYDSDSSF